MDPTITQRSETSPQIPTTLADQADRTQCTEHQEAEAETPRSQNADAPDPPEVRTNKETRRSSIRMPISDEVKLFTNEDAHHGDAW